MPSIDTTLIKTTANHTKDIINKNIGPISGKYLLIYDTQSTLAKLLRSGYEEVLPEPFESINFEEMGENFKSSLISLPKDSLVILIQSTNFRITDFRIRLEL